MQPPCRRTGTGTGADRDGRTRWANHTYSHGAPEALAGYLADLDRNEPLLRELLPGPAERWRVFRYPFLRQGDTGEIHDAIRAHLAERGYRIAEVTVDFGDHAWNEPHARCLARGDRASWRS